MIKDVIVFVYCSACNDGLHPKEYRELEPDIYGAKVLVDKVGIDYVSYELEPPQLEIQTIAEFVKNKMCRKCRKKSLKELVK